jgi:putative membrane protein
MRSQSGQHFGIGIRWALRSGSFLPRVTGTAMADDPKHRKLSGEEFRLLLQLETSLLMWLRTSLALMGFGFVIARFGLFLRELAGASQIHVPPRPWLVGMSTASGTALIVLGVIVLLLAVVNHQRTMRRLLRGELPMPSAWSFSVILSLILAGLGMGMAIYLTLV